MKQIYAAIPALELFISAVLAQPSPSATTRQFIIVQPQARPVPGLLTNQNSSDRLLLSADTLPLPPIRWQTHPARLSPVPKQSWIPVPVSEESDGWWAGLNIRPDQPPILPRRYVPTISPAFPRANP